MEIGTGGYPDNKHCPLDDLVADPAKAKAWLKNSLTEIFKSPPSAATVIPSIRTPRTPPKTPTLSKRPSASPK